ncbi:HxlR family transcriptional regulator [Clostridium sp. MF28]|uniref:winged helix-turn-helix transcriptional regulator n=1 Tax=Clostridium TaxID=1485 RepID=UPI000CF91058|nr:MULTISPECIES: helix-turn-helix domain-containing protein [Clostridium]AVK49368.1 HxlR family transcriptional regulator [Clostridium sp. MF28]PSM58016.1 transcriptional regulator [Clostridium diolis]
MGLYEQIKDITYEEYIALAHSEVECSTDNLVLNSLQLLSGKWRLIVIFQLSLKSSFRFGELKRMIPGITNTMLTTILRELEECGIASRKQFNEIPPHVEYSLTIKGKELFPIFFELFKWGVKYL